LSLIKTWTLATGLTLSAICQLALAADNINPVEQSSQDDSNAILNTISDYFATQSGPVGVAPTGDQLASYYHKNGVQWFENRSGGVDRTSPVEEAQAYAEILLKRDFLEEVVSSDIKVYGNMAHAFIVYQISDTKKTKTPRKGLDSVQLAKINGQWKVLSMFFVSEMIDRPLNKEEF